MWTSTFVVADALPAQPATVTLLSTVARSAMAMSVSFVTGAQAPAVGVGVGVGVGFGAGVSVDAPVNSSLFGEPLPTLVTLPAVAAPTSASRTCCGLAAGCVARYRAAA